MNTLKGLKRTHLCGDLTSKNIGEEVIVMGWVQRVRDLGGLIFVDLRDKTGLLQLVADSGNKEMYDMAQGLHQEYVIAASGRVQIRGEGAINPNMKTGEIEVELTKIRVLSVSETPPFVIDDETNAREETRLKYRYLDLRRPCVQENFFLRHRLTQIARNFYDKNGFIEIETPVLTKSTPEGARDYLVPSRVHSGHFYALPQSPQLYKQLLMLSGFDRYMQIAKCFRDEDLRADRQPEFTQIDLEMSFVDADDVMSINEKFIQRVFKEIKNIDLTLPLPRLSYTEAMERYGSDKPDTRFEMELHNLSDTVKNCEFKVFTDAIASGGSVRCITVVGGANMFSRKEIDALAEFVKTYRAKGLAWISLAEEGTKGSVAKFFSEDEIGAIATAAHAKTGDLILIVADKDKVVFDSLGALRIHVAGKLGMIDESKYNLLWVTDFPLFDYDEDEGRFVAMHHPFTAPKDEDIELVETAPERAKAKAYDIILNGTELGGGSIRIHQRDLQAKMFRAIGMSEEEAQSRFGFLLEAFKYGAPPHGGMAYGLDRFVMILGGCPSIRDVIAFPKVQNASELMSGAPGFVDLKQLDELCIKLTKNDEENKE